LTAAGFNCLQFYICGIRNQSYRHKQHIVKHNSILLTLKLPTTTIVAQPFNVIKWQLKFNPVA